LHIESKIKVGVQTGDTSVTKNTPRKKVVQINQIKLKRVMLSKRNCNEYENDEEPDHRRFGQLQGD